jgi:hypothetical protein
LNIYIEIWRIIPDNSWEGNIPNINSNSTLRLLWIKLIYLIAQELNNSNGSPTTENGKTKKTSTTLKSILGSLDQKKEYHMIISHSKESNLKNQKINNEKIKNI